MEFYIAVETPKEILCVPYNILICEEAIVEWWCEPMCVLIGPFPEWGRGETLGIGDVKPCQASQVLAGKRPFLMSSAVPSEVQTRLPTTHSETAATVISEEAVSTYKEPGA